MREAPEKNRRRGLRWWQGGLLFVAALAGQLALGIALVAIALALSSTEIGKDRALDFVFRPAGLIIQVLFTSALLLGLALLAAGRWGAGAVRTLRLARPRPRAALLAIAGVLPAGIAIDEATFLLHSLAPDLFAATALDTFAETFGQAGSLAFATLALTISLGPGIAEELFFRGMLLGSFRGEMPAWLAVVFSSLLFGLLHLDPLQGSGAALIGAYLALVVITTGSVWPAIGAHALNNLSCALCARYDPQGVGQAFSTGYPPWVVALAVLLTAVVVVRLVGHGRANFR